VVATRPDAFPEALDELAFVYACLIVTKEASVDDVAGHIERLTTQADRLVELARIDVTPETDDLGTDVRDLANQPLLSATSICSSVTRMTRMPATFIWKQSRRLVRTVPPRRGLHARPRADRPQDGRVRVRLGVQDLDLRVSTIPTIHGESVVLRLLEKKP
jgi:hypothetical protein